MGVEDAMVRRAFADLPHGQLHYRHAGSGEVLLLLHGSPGSARQLVRMIDGFAPDLRVIAPDTPGNGDSEPLPLVAPEIADLAGAMLRFLDSLGLAQCHVYGTHTGAAIAAELAIAAPGRVRSVMLDGISDLAGEELEEFLDCYASPFEADLDGDYLARLFGFCRDQFRYFPWYRHTSGAQRDTTPPHPDALDALVLETLKARTSYQRNYHAAFRWPARARLGLIPCPVVLMASTSDPLCETTRALAPFARGGTFQALPRYDAPDFAAQRRAAMMHFMAMEG
jgi:pimeloyl-ACP methyl ester carboxylesterase